MSNAAKVLPLVSNTRYFGLAEILETDEKDMNVYLRLSELSGKPQARARIAIPGDQNLDPGDEVLAVGEDFENLYVIGLLKRKKPSATSSKRLMLANGTYSAIQGEPESQTISVFSKRNELLFEYDPNLEKARVVMESGDIEFATRDGDIKFNAAGTVKLDGQKIEMASRSSIRLAVEDAIGLIRSAVSLERYKMKLSSPELGVTAQRSALHMEETRFTGKKFFGKLTSAHLIVGKLETFAKTIIQKAQNVYHTVEQLSQLKTGRMRTLVDTTFHMKSKKTFLKSQEDFKINANKIHLG